MRIITRTRLLEASKLYPKAKPTLEHWHAITKAATWGNLAQTKSTFPHADLITVASGKNVIVFNITNNFRLITAIHYNRQCVFILRFLTHADYDKDTWKRDL